MEGNIYKHIVCLLLRACENGGGVLREHVVFLALCASEGGGGLLPSSAGLCGLNLNSSSHQHTHPPIPPETTQILVVTQLMDS